MNGVCSGIWNVEQGHALGTMPVTRQWDFLCNTCWQIRQGMLLIMLGPGLSMSLAGGKHNVRTGQRERDLTTTTLTKSCKPLFHVLHQHAVCKPTLHNCMCTVHQLPCHASLPGFQQNSERLFGMVYYIWGTAHRRTGITPPPPQPTAEVGEGDGIMPAGLLHYSHNHKRGACSRHAT